MIKLMTAILLMTPTSWGQMAQRSAGQLHFFAPTELSSSLRISSPVYLPNGCEDYDKWAAQVAPRLRPISLQKMALMRREMAGKEGLILTADGSNLSRVISEKMKFEFQDAVKEQQKDSPHPETWIDLDEAPLIFRPQALPQVEIDDQTPDTLRALSKKAGLPDPVIKAKVDPKGLHIQVAALDVVCDLIKGRSRLKILMPLLLKFYPPHVEKIRSAAATAQETLKPVFDSSSPIPMKAALAGFKTGKEWTKWSADLPKAKDEEKQAIGFLNQWIDWSKMTIRESDPAVLYPDDLEVNDVPLYLEF